MRFVSDIVIYAKTNREKSVSNKSRSAVLAFLTLTVSIIFLFVFKEKKIYPSWDHGSIVYYIGLGITSDNQSYLGRRITRVEWFTTDGLHYRAWPIGDKLFKFQITHDNFLLADGTTIQENFNPYAEEGAPHFADTGLPYDASAALESKNYNIEGEVICEVKSGTGRILLPRRSVVAKGRICGLYEIEKATVKRVCFLDKQMQDIHKEDLDHCSTWSH